MEIFFDNPFMILVMLALFSISSLFKKASEKQKQSSNNPVDKRVPKPSNPFEEVKEIFKEVSRNLQEEIPKSPAPKLHEIYKEKKMEVNQQRELTDRNKQETDSTRNAIEVSAPLQQSKKSIEINETKLIESVIWSEILGPPRSKKPYYKSRK